MASDRLDLQEVISLPGKFAFPKERRLRARREFVAAQDSGRRVHTPHFVLIVARGPESDAPSRLGVTVTRKVGSSVRRNRVKRLVREAFRLDPEMLPPGIDLVVIAKDGAPTLALADVQSEWAGVRVLLLKRCREALALTKAPTVPKEQGR